jgi:hypothetical protein
MILIARLAFVQQINKRRGRQDPEPATKWMSKKESQRKHVLPWILSSLPFPCSSPFFPLYSIDSKVTPFAAIVATVRPLRPALFLLGICFSGFPFSVSGCILDYFIYSRVFALSEFWTILMVPMLAAYSSSDSF